MLSAFVWPWEEATDSQTLPTINRPMLLVTGDGMGDLTKKFAQLIANDKRNTVITYPGAIAAYLLFEVDRELEPTIASRNSSATGDKDNDHSKSENQRLRKQADSFEGWNVWLWHFHAQSRS